MKKLATIFIIICVVFLNNACFVFAKEDILISKTEKTLKSELKKQYSAYEYVITNASQKRLNITNAQIINGTNGNAAYNQTEVSIGKQMGIHWAIMGPVGLFTLGIGWVVGLLGMPFIYLFTNKKNKKSERESAVYTNNIPLGFIEPNENIIVMTLAPIGISPQLKITVYDDKTKEYNVINY